MSQRKRRPPVNRHFKIDLVLSPADRQAYEAFLREPAATVDTAHAWLTARGYANLSRSAVARHKRLFLEKEEAHAAALRKANAYARLATSAGAPDLVSGAMLYTEHMLMERAFDLKHKARADDRAVTPQELNELLDVLSAAIKTREQLRAFKDAMRRTNPAAQDVSSAGHGPPQ